MIYSMTGYGKGKAVLDGGTLTVEIRSVNSKGADVSIKSSLLPREHDMEIRKLLQDRLVRGTIDMFLTWEPGGEVQVKGINAPVALEYWREMKDLLKSMGAGVFAGEDLATVTAASAILRMPDVMDTERRDIVTEENWPLVRNAIDDALEAIEEYRRTEGEALYRDVTGRVALILSIYDEVEGYMPERVAAVRERLSKEAEELKVRLDPERFEQEIIFYLEKLDINEERVRLRQHCKYFMETIDTDPYPGKKLGFIIQEMGREINTTGSKANHFGIQQCVVRMKDELEKIREQSMNIL